MKRTVRTWMLTGNRPVRSGGGRGPLCPGGIALLAVCLALFTGSCRKEDSLDIPPPHEIGGERWAQTALDQWLYDSLTKPYNIAVKYRWDPWELNLDKTLTPPDESKIIPAMSAIKRVWIDPYNAETGSPDFIRKYAPKQFKLIGSVEYNYNGTVLLGQAEGGNNIAFFDINQHFDKDPINSIRRMIQTSHHEFAHILHQNVLYPQEFKGISSQLGLPGYTSTWFNVFPDEALASGYITPYAMASYDEDFVEMVANMLMEGKPRFEEMLTTVSPTARQALRTKEEFVVNYFREVWNIDFYSLQTRVQAALKALVPVPAPGESYGFGRSHTIADVDPDQPSLLPHGSGFNTRMNNARTAVAAIPNLGLALDSLALVAVGTNQSVLRMYVRQSGNIFFADFNYAASAAGNTLDLTYQSANGNGQVIQAAVQPLLDYFNDYTFTMTWHADPTVSIFPRIRFTPGGLANGHFIARLFP